MKALIEHPEEFQQAQASIFTPGGLREAAASWAENVGQTKQRGLALYLASDAGSWVTGQIITVAGGM